MIGFGLARGLALIALALTGGESGELVLGGESRMGESSMNIALDSESSVGESEVNSIPARGLLMSISKLSRFGQNISVKSISESKSSMCRIIFCDILSFLRGMAIWTSRFSYDGVGIDRVREVEVEVIVDFTRFFAGLALAFTRFFAGTVLAFGFLVPPIRLEVLVVNAPMGFVEGLTSGMAIEFGVFWAVAGTKLIGLVCVAGVAKLVLIIFR